MEENKNENVEQKEVSEVQGEYKFCKDCGKKINKNAEICPYCGVRQQNSVSSVVEESGALGVLAIVFGALGGWLGLVFGIIGLCINKNPKNRKNCKIGIGLFFGWLILWIIFFIVIIGGAAAAVSYGTVGLL